MSRCLVSSFFVKSSFLIALAGNTRAGAPCFVGLSNNSQDVAFKDKVLVNNSLQLFPVGWYDFSPGCLY